MIVDDDDIELLQAVIELLVVTVGVGHLRTICCESELIERKIQLFFKQELCPKVVRGELEKKSGVSGLTCK